MKAPPFSRGSFALLIRSVVTVTRPQRQRGVGNGIRIMIKIVSLNLAAFFAAGAVSAAPVEERVSFGDLDLSSRAGALEFDARISRAADRFCRVMRAVERPICRNGFRHEALSLLPKTARNDYSKGRFTIAA